MNYDHTFEWVFSPVNGVADYRCGNPLCNRRAPIGYEDFNVCPYCAVKKIKNSNSLNKLPDDDTYLRILMETELELGRLLE